MIANYGTLGNSLVDFANANMLKAIQSALNKSTIPVKNTVTQSLSNVATPQKLISKVNDLIVQKIKPIQVKELSPSNVVTSPPIPKGISSYLTTKNILIFSGISTILLIGFKK